jgi:hypothetical protein
MKVQVPLDAPKCVSASEPDLDVDLASLRMDPRHQKLLDEHEAKRENYYVEAHTDGFQCLARLVEFIMLRQDCLSAKNKLNAVMKELVSGETQGQMRAKAAEAGEEHWSANPLWRILLKLCNEILEEMNVSERERRQRDIDRQEEREQLMWSELIRASVSDPFAAPQQHQQQHQHQHQHYSHPAKDPYQRKPGTSFEVPTHAKTQAMLNMMSQGLQGFSQVMQEQSRG